MTTKVEPTEYIKPERDDGNQEYKLKLVDIPATKIEQIASQMRYRMDEGNGEAFYTLGVTDSGGVVGLSEDDYKTSISLLESVARKNSYSLTLLSEKDLGEGKKLVEFLVREKNNHRYVDIRVACAGQVDAGKSSLLGVLLSGQNDDGRGKARLSIFNFPHEIRTGRTSSVAQHIMGFDEKGQPVHCSDNLGRKKSWPDIVKASSKIITFFDLCGHEKYLKTTIFGLSANSPDLVFILVGGNMGLTKMAKEHILLCLSLRLPFVIIITKMDICKERQQVLKETVQDIKKLLKAPGIQKTPYDIRDMDDILLSNKQIHSLSIVPIFYVSNVSGEGINNLKHFLNLHQKKPRDDKEAQNSIELCVELHVDQVFHVAGVGMVIGGQLVQGAISVGDKLIVGPSNNSYFPIQVRSIHCKRVSVERVEAGCYVCLGVRKSDNLLVRRGNVILSVFDKPIQVRSFEAEVAILKSHSTTVKIGYQPVIHVSSVRQIASITDIREKRCGRGKSDNDQILRTGDKAVITFRFCYRPEFLHVGTRMLMAEGQVKMIGRITKIYEEELGVV